MIAFNKIFSAFLVVVYAAVVTAAPANPGPGAKLATHRSHSLGQGGLGLTAYHPVSTYETFGEGEVVTFRQQPGVALEASVIDYVTQKLGVDAGSVSYTHGYSTDTVSVAYVKQRHNGIDFSNAVANVAFKGDRVLAFGSSFVKPNNIAPSEPKIAVNDAIATAERALGGTYNNHPAKLEYLAKDDGSAALVHVVQIQNEAESKWYEAFIGAHDGKVLSVNNFVNDATYRVVPISKQYATQGFETLVDPEDTVASPNGWMNDGVETYTRTLGNNVLAAKGTNSGTSPQTGPNEFIYEWNPSVPPTTAPNVDVARVNAFYVANTVHDIAYRYGFTEWASNFQWNNFNRGGQGKDPVYISVQDATDFNNAFFTTPPEGQAPLMQMFLWNVTNPHRDGSLENSIIIHEYTHGITNRMTGGGTARCLQTLESAGMGEGWGDAFADWNAQNSAPIKDLKLGEYVYTKNIRHYPYSTDPNTNPLIYADIYRMNEVHDIGEVWANTLHNVLNAFATQFGWSDTARTDPTGGAGNVRYLHLFFDSLALQPCNPTFIQARNAWFAADTARYFGAHHCLLWRAFASRGLGFSAANYNNAFDVPPNC